MKFEWFPEELDPQATAIVKKFLSKGLKTRIYFCFSVDSHDTLVLLDAELKKKTDGNYGKAVQNMKDYWNLKGD